MGMMKHHNTCFPITSRATPPAIEDRQVETRRGLVTTLVIFQRKGISKGL
jgi:hypothetical protein